jgi:hypothetical protein
LAGKVQEVDEGGTLKTFIVYVREVHVQQVRIQAESKEEAVKKVEEGDGEFLNNALEYSHSLEPETWTVEEEKT